jgi:mono/diheme cytochrome c family protein
MLRGVRLMVVLGLAVGALGLAACGDDDDDAADQAESALSEAADVQSSVQEQAESAMSDAQEQGESIMSEAQSAIDEATSQAESAAEEAESAVDEATSEAESAIDEATSEAGAGGGDAAAGKEVFTANCSACHTLADAGASGAVGPNLDDAAPDQAAVEAKVRTGGGGMPAFEGQLSDDEIVNVAAYVSSVAGQ